MTKWREALCSTYVQLDSQSDAEDFFGIITLPVPGSASLSVVSSTRQLTERTPELIRRDPQDVILLILQHRGTGVFEQDDRQIRLNAGEFTLCDTTRPYRLKFNTPFEQIDLRLPRRKLFDGQSTCARISGQKFDGNHGPALVLSGFIRQLSRDGGRLSAPILDGFENTLLHMLRTTIELSAADAGEPVCGGALSRLETRLRDHLQDPELTPRDLARNAGMSLRSLQRILQTAGTTPRGWLLSQRLAGIARDLRSPTEAGRSITDIAFSWGFRDLSHFSRSFRARFGSSARAWRKA